MNPLAMQLVDVLRTTGQRLVCAESCTCGALAAALGEIPGVSEFFCGSAVTYREATKESWLGVREESLREFSAVSIQVAREMAWGVLKQTAHAHVSLSTTGYLGPSSPLGEDGLVYVGFAHRSMSALEQVEVNRLSLKAGGRQERRDEVVREALSLASAYVKLVSSNMSD